MSQRTIRVGLMGLATLVAIALAIVAAVAGALPGRDAGSGRDTGSGRELVLVARGMAFYLPGSNQPNPTLRVAPGERIRVRLVNDEAGVLHDVAVDALDFSVPAFRERGERSAWLTAPAQPGRHEYVCTFHRAMMRGELEVSAEIPTTAGR